MAAKSIRCIETNPARRRLASQGLWHGGLALAVSLLCSAGSWAQTSPAATEAESAELQARVRVLREANAAVVGVKTIAVEDARSVETLGRKRQGSGVVIDSDGLVLTIGYLILEAENVDLVIEGERTVPARVVAYDLASGFGLLQALAPVKVAAVRFGVSAEVSSTEPLMISSGGEDAARSLARLVSRRAFSGYWEYHIEGALFTAPPRSDHSGAALFNANGELLGIGSLMVGNALGDEHPRMPGNMFVPIDLLKPILTEMRRDGASRSSSRAWLGLNCVEQDGVVRVIRVNRDSPAEDAGLLVGDRIVSIDGTAVTQLETFYKTLWRSAVQRDVVLEIRRAGQLQTIKVHSVDRTRLLSKPKGI
ncbi:MAG: S1C family serine protease [Burkholderiaceae bacterium]